YTVTNAGTHATRVDTWTDQIYLSSDASLDTTDRPLAAIQHSSGEGLLAAGASYTRTVNVQIPQSIQGNFNFLLMLDNPFIASANTAPGAAGGTIEDWVPNPGGAVKEYQGEGNNLAALSVTVSLAPT